MAVAAFGQVDIQLGGGRAFRQCVQYGGRVVAARQDFQQAAAGVEAVVEAEPAFFEEGVTAHFAGQQGTVFLHRRFDEAVAGFFHNRLAAVLFNPRCQQAGGFDVENHFGAGVAAEYVLRVQHQLAVGIDNLAVFGDHAQTVAVAVESQADFGIAVLQRADQILQVFRFGGIGVVVGEVAVHFAEEFCDGATQCAEQIAGISTGYAVAGIDHDVHRAGEFDVVNNRGLIGGGEILFAYFAVAGYELVVLNGGEQLLHGFTGQGVAGQHHFKAVVIGRVVAAGNHHAAAAAFFDSSKIKHGGGDHADIEYVQTAFGDAAHQVFAQFGAAETAVAANGNAADAKLGAAGGNGFAD